MMYWDGNGGGWAVGMVILMILFWGSIVAALWVGVRALSNRPRQAGSMDRQNPRDILAERLARGEIEPEEFQHRLEMLGGKR